MKRIVFLVLAVVVMTLVTSCGTSKQTAASQVPASQPTTQPGSSTGGTSPTTQTASSTSGTSVSFANDVMPIFNNTCIKCHGVEDVKAGLDMRTYDALMAGSFKGPDVVAGSADQSMLIRLILNGKMPKRATKLTTEQIQIITNWVNAGALNN
jgi:hypothetical protein